LVPPFVEHLAESFASYTVYGMMDLFSGYDQWSLHEESWDLTTFGMPLGPHQLTTLPMGHANSVQLFQGDIMFVLQDEIPWFTLPFIDDIASKSVKTRYQRADGSYETIPENPGVHHFIWEHLQVQNRILHRLRIVGLTVSALGHTMCTMEG
jgi:hypothetical protein